MILHTNALSAFVDGEVGVGKFLLRADTAIPVIVFAEFRYGISPSRHRAAHEKWLDNHLSGFDILAVTDKAAVVYAALRVALRRAIRFRPTTRGLRPSSSSTASPS